LIFVFFFQKKHLSDKTKLCELLAAVQKTPMLNVKKNKSIQSYILHFLVYIFFSLSILYFYTIKTLNVFIPENVILD